MVFKEENAGLKDIFFSSDSFGTSGPLYWNVCKDF